MKNFNKHSIDYYNLRQDQKENQKKIKEIVENSPEVETEEKDGGGYNITRSQIMLDIEALYKARKNDGYERFEDIIDYLEYVPVKTKQKDLEFLIDLFIKRKNIKRKLSVIKRTLATSLYNNGKKLLQK